VSSNERRRKRTRGLDVLHAVDTRKMTMVVSNNLVRLEIPAFHHLRAPPKVKKKVSFDSLPSSLRPSLPLPPSLSSSPSTSDPREKNNSPYPLQH